ncbi:hypothetical protein [Nocardia carnea]|uniref:hypothetical protein n=1 Tax=Nocardia carnea TaxID=37328 RepID=UPI0024541A57|nr:hypothetical protein [Nocardia carnea]
MLTVRRGVPARPELCRRLSGRLRIRPALELWLPHRLGLRAARVLRLSRGRPESLRRHTPLLLPLWSPWLLRLPTRMRCRRRELWLRRRELAGCGHALWRLTAGVTHRSPPESS